MQSVRGVICSESSRLQAEVPAMAGWPLAYTFSINFRVDAQTRCTHKRIRVSTEVAATCLSIRVWTVLVVTQVEQHKYYIYAVCPQVLQKKHRRHERK